MSYVSERLYNPSRAHYTPGSYQKFAAFCRVSSCFTSLACSSAFSLTGATVAAGAAGATGPTFSFARAVSLDGVDCFFWLVAGAGSADTFVGVSTFLSETNTRSSLSSGSSNGVEFGGCTKSAAFTKRPRVATRPPRVRFVRLRLLTVPREGVVVFLAPESEAAAAAAAAFAPPLVAPPLALPPDRRARCKPLPLVAVGISSTLDVDENRDSRAGAVLFLLGFFGFDVCPGG